VSVDQSILDKIRKLHALAENAGTEAEAASAAQFVADICRKHNLDIGVATLAEEETKASEGVHEHASSIWRKHYSWLSDAVDKLFDVAHYQKPAGRVKKDAAGRVIGSTTVSECHFYGLKANVASAVVTYQYLLASVESMLESYLRTGGQLRGRVDFDSFRIGCACRINDEAKKVKQEVSALIAGSTESQALMVLANKLVKDHYRAMNLRSTKRSSGRKNQNAYEAGYAAGGRVDLHGARTSRMIA